MYFAGKNGRPNRAARRAATLLVPPIENGGCGWVSGRGVPRTVVPRYSNGSPLQAFSIVSTASSMSAPRFAQSLP